MKVFSSVIVRLLKSRAVHHVPESRPLASGARISAANGGVRQGEALHCLSIKLGIESSLASGARISAADGGVRQGEALHCLSIKLGIESSLASDARISAGTFTGDNYFTEVDRVSRLFEKGFADGGVRQGEALHCLSIKLGIESSLASGARISAGTFTGARISAGTFTGDSYFTRVDTVEMKMREIAKEIAKESSIPLDRKKLLLQAVSRLFEEQFVDEEVRKGEQLHCLSIKLGIESHHHRNLITLYGRQLDTNRENIRLVFQIIPRALFYKSLNSMVHAFAFMCPKDAYAAFGMIVKLGVPNEDNISGLIDAKKNDSLIISKPRRVELAGENIKMYMKHYRIPFTPKIYGALVGLISKALQTLLEMPKIDDIGITSFLSGCLKHGDMISASTLVRYLEKNGVIYKLGETMRRHLIFNGIGVKFGENVMIEEKTAGRSQVTVKEESEKPTGGIM